MSQTTMKLPVKPITALVLGVLSLVVTPVIFFMFKDTYLTWEKTPFYLTIAVYASFFFGVLGGIGGLPYLILPGTSKGQRIMGLIAIVTAIIGCSAMVSVYQV